MYLRHDLSVGGFSAWKIGPLAFLLQILIPHNLFLSRFPSSAGRRFAGRGAWVLTAYGISGLALFGVLAYFFSDFIAR